MAELRADINNLSSLSANLQSIVSATANCGFIDTDSGSLNTVESQIKQFNETADAGCSEAPSCGDSKACQAQSLGCVQEIASADANSLANDGVVSACELMQNCIGANCFAQ